MSEFTLHDTDARKSMDSIYRWQVGIYDATRKYYLLGRDRLINQLAPSRQQTVLEMGCGTGRNLVQAAKRYPDVRFFGLDVSDVMLSHACDAVQKSGRIRQIKLARADATAFNPQISFGEKHFDRVYFSYTLSMIPPWKAALQQAFDVLAPGGALHIVDFADFERLPSPFGRMMRLWLKQFHVFPQPELPAEFRRLATAAQASVEETRLYRGYAVHLVARKPAV
jgi:S-adenosylmethionine-diacylgycerolhomoserine-N-methlytransferase